jgi:hypothetical protein
MLARKSIPQSVMTNDEVPKPERSPKDEALISEFKSLGRDDTCKYFGFRA